MVLLVLTGIKIIKNPLLITILILHRCKHIYETPRGNLFCAIKCYFLLEIVHDLLPDTPAERPEI